MPGFLAERGPEGNLEGWRKGEQVQRARKRLESGQGALNILATNVLAHNNLRKVFVRNLNENFQQLPQNQSLTCQDF